MVLTLPKKKSDYSPGENPRSLENLSTREPIYGERKKRREITVTDGGWEGAKQRAKADGLPSLSELIEQYGRGLLDIVIKKSE